MMNLWMASFGVRGRTLSKIYTKQSNKCELGNYGKPRKVEASSLKVEGESTFYKNYMSCLISHLLLISKSMADDLFFLLVKKYLYSPP